MREIRTHIDRLEKEISSCWPYPNKGRKGIKVEALALLIKEAEVKSIEDAIATVKKAHPEATLGSVSTRTADLFNKLLVGNKNTAGVGL